MIRAEDLSVFLGGDYIFKSLNFSISPGEKVALTGRNGSGKTTLLRVIAGELKPDEGRLILAKNKHIGYLKQHMDSDLERTVWETALSAFGKLLECEKRLKKWEEKPDEAGADEYHEWLERYRIHGGYTFRGETENVLKGLGFEPEDFGRKLKTFSGGWRMRAELARLLLSKPDVLLLDEPTNHLDIESIVWFEQYLKNFDGIVVLVSHDRRFLDRVTDRTMEIVKGRLWDFKVPYSRFVQKKRTLIEKWKQEAKNQEKKIKETERLIEKFRYKATKASFAQSLIKKLEKTERIEVPEEDLRNIKLQFPQWKPTGKVVFEASGLTKRYGEKTVFENLEFLISRGEKIAFVGRNGAGKTTLAGILAGEADYEGELKTGYHVKTGYFRQDLGYLRKLNHTVLSFLEEAATEESRPKVRDVAGAFLFSGEDVEKPLSVLSGGELNRLVLASLMLQPFNVLILDEPTNHLDMHGKEVLKQALKQFEGTVIVVSHDRDFLDGLTQRTFYFTDGTVRDWLGDLNRVLNDIEQKTKAEKELIKAGKPERKPGKERQERRKALKRLKNRLQKIENQIEEIEKRLKEMENQMATGENADDVSFYSRYESLKRELEELMAEWEQLSMTLEEEF